MAGFSTDLAQKVINHFFRNTSVTPSTTLYLALFPANPTDDSTTANGLELNPATFTWYGRKEIAFNAPGADATTENNAQLTFDAVTGSSVTITHWGIYGSDVENAGNLMCSGAFSTSKVLNVDDRFVVNGGDLVLTFD